MTPGVRSSSQIVHWIRMLNYGPDPLVVHNGQVMGEWEVVDVLESQLLGEDGHPEEGLASRYRASPKMRCGKPRSWTSLHRDQLQPDEREKALWTLGQYAGVFKLPGESMGPGQGS